MAYHLCPICSREIKNRFAVSRDDYCIASGFSGNTNRPINAIAKSFRSFHLLAVICEDFFLIRECIVVFVGCHCTVRCRSCHGHQLARSGMKFHVSHHSFPCCCVATHRHMAGGIFTQLLHLAYFIRQWTLGRAIV